MAYYITYESASALLCKHTFCGPIIINHKNSYACLLYSASTLCVTFKLTFVIFYTAT